MLEGQEGVTWDEWVAAATDGRTAGLRGHLHVGPLLQRHGQPRSRLVRRLDEPGRAGRRHLARSGSARSCRPSRSVSRRCWPRRAVTVDRISGGRVEIGMGAGWWEEEHRTHGFPLPPGARALRPARRAARDRARAAHRGASSRSTARTTSSTTRGSRPRACRSRTRRSSWAATADRGWPRLVSRWADEFNTVGVGPAGGRERVSTRVRDQLDADGRDPRHAHHLVHDVVLRRRDARPTRCERIERARERAMRAGRSTTSSSELARHLHRRLGRARPPSA